jgi:hypothetical protein
VYKHFDDLWQHVYLRQPDGSLAAARKYSFPDIGGPPYRPRTVFLGPGKIHEETIDLWTYVEKPDKDCRCRLWIELEVKQPYAPSRKDAMYWTGKVRSNELDVTIKDGKVTGTVAPNTAKVSEPAVKDGLSVTVALAKGVFAEKEAGRFTVTLKNVGDKPFLLYEERWPPSVNCVLGISDAQTGAQWKVGYAVPVPGLPPPKPADSRLLKPGESSDQQFVLSGAGIYFYDANQQPDPANRRDFLPQGKYRLTCTIAYRANPSIQVPDPRQWADTLVSNPVEFEITAEKAR